MIMIYVILIVALVIRINSSCDYLFSIFSVFISDFDI